MSITLVRGIEPWNRYGSKSGSTNWLEKIKLPCSLHTLASSSKLPSNISTICALFRLFRRMSPGNSRLNWQEVYSDAKWQYSRSRVSEPHEKKKNDPDSNHHKNLIEDAKISIFHDIIICDCTEKNGLLMIKKTDYHLHNKIQLGFVLFFTFFTFWLKTKKKWIRLDPKHLYPALMPFFPLTSCLKRKKERYKERIDQIFV